MKRGHIKIGYESSRIGSLDGVVFSVLEVVSGRRISALPAAWHLFRHGLVVMLFCFSVLVVADTPTKADPRNVEVAFLRNFTHYVNWPKEAFADTQDPWRICVLGNDPFGDVLERTFEGRTEQGRSFTILRSQDPAELSHCQIVYVAFKVSANRRAALSELKGRPVLTVSNAPGFLQEGGIIRFDVTDYVGLSVNLDQARAASLAVQTKVLEVSSAVIENGAVRRVR